MFFDHKKQTKNKKDIMNKKITKPYFHIYILWDAAILQLFSRFAGHVLLTKITFCPHLTSQKIVLS